MQQCAPPSAADRNGEGITADDKAQLPPTSSTSHSLPESQQDLGFDVVPPLEDICRDLFQRVEAFLAEQVEDDVLKQVQKQTKIALEVIEEALARYGLDHLCFSYNGGKDCLVLLILYLVGLYAHLRARSPGTGLARRMNGSSSTQGQDDRQGAIGATTTTSDGRHSDSDAGKASRDFTDASPFPTQLTSIHIQTPHPFPEVTSFVDSSSAYYHLDLVESNLPMKAAFTEYLKEHHEVEAIFVGTRRTDPHGGNLTFFDMTDRGWPKFMRIHPVIDWHYREIWGFIRYLKIPYCKLYDLGYTSLGGTNDTHPNPKLAANKSAVAETSQLGLGRVEAELTQFRPAYELMDDEEERLGRDK